MAWANVRAAKDYADGQAGVIALCLGFLLQAVGYVLSIGGVSAETDGSSAAGVAVAFVAVAAVLTWGAARLTRWPRTRAYLVKLPGDEAGTRRRGSQRYELMRYADVLGRLPDDERGRVEEHCQRVWRVARVRTRR